MPSQKPFSFFQSLVSHLAPKVSRFGLNLEDEWIFDHYVVSNPTGYLSLQVLWFIIQA
jgi:hypothetical protein